MPRKRKSTGLFEDRHNVFNIFRMGESYTSLILGIIVVIVGTVLLLSVARSRSDTPQTSSSSTSGIATKVTDSGDEIVISTDPNELENRDKRSQSGESTSRSTSIKAGTAYKVQEGDDLWDIAERAYGDGYSWIEIARANNLSNPNTIEIGTELMIPKIDQVSSTSKGGVAQDNNNNQEIKSVNKISGEQYIVVKGDNLWEIAVRAYGDGYKWIQIAETNGLSNPDLIHSGNKLKIIRK